MKTEDAVWAAIFAAGIGYEIAAIRREQWDRTMTRMTRKWWRTQHPVGAAIFVGTWMGFAGWYAWHVVRGGLGEEQ